MGDEMGPQKHWTIDRRIPIAVILAILGQTAAALWWAANVSSRIEALETAQHSAIGRELRLQTLERDVPVIREKIQSIEKTTDRIEKKLDKISANFGVSQSDSMEDLMMLSLKELGEIRVS